MFTTELETLPIMRDQTVLFGQQLLQVVVSRQGMERKLCGKH